MIAPQSSGSHLKVSPRDIALALIAILYASSAVLKLTALTQLNDSIGSAGLFPARWSGPIGILTIAAELTAALLIVIPLVRSKGIFLAQCLSALFFGYSLWRFYQDIPVPCSCFGPLFTVPPLAMVLLNVVILTVLTLISHSYAGLSESQHTTLP